MINVVGSKDDYSRWKPSGFKKHRTVAELAEFVGRSTSSIYKAERQKRIGAPIRVKVGRLQVRLYSPAECAKVKRYFDAVRSDSKV